MGDGETLADVGYAALLGVVQGITEFLPVSSSAHLIIASYFTQGETLPLTLNIGLHVGTSVSVLLYFWRDWLGLALGAWRRIVAGEASVAADRLLPALMVGSLPAGILGLLWKDAIERYLHHPLIVVGPLALVGALLVVVDRRARTRGVARRGLEDLSWIDGLVVGCAQACALIPGTSRSGATILGGLWRGLRREDAARFSFLLGTPAMLGAALLDLRNLSAGLQDLEFVVGFCVSVVAGCLAIRWLLLFLSRQGFLVFAIYRALLAIAVGFGYFFVRTPLS